MADIEKRLVLLAVIYGRYSCEIDGRYGFVSRDGLPEELYDTIAEAIAAEGKAIREIMVEEQEQIKALEESVNLRLLHLGVLEM